MRLASEGRRPNPKPKPKPNPNPKPNPRPNLSPDPNLAPTLTLTLTLTRTLTLTITLTLTLTLSEGRRTVGQQEGTRTINGTCVGKAASALSVPADCDAVTGVGCPCWGWVDHLKPVVRKGGTAGRMYMIAGNTAIIHMTGGVVDRIMWDSSCNLCRGNLASDAQDPDNLVCMADRSNATVTTTLAPAL